MIWKQTSKQNNYFAPAACQSCLSCQSKPASRPTSKPASKPASEQGTNYFASHQASSQQAHSCKSESAAEAKGSAGRDWIVGRTLQKLKPHEPCPILCPTPKKQGKLCQKYCRHRTNRIKSSDGAKSKFPWNPEVAFLNS